MNELTAMKKQRKLYFFPHDLSLLKIRFKTPWCNESKTKQNKKLQAEIKLRYLRSEEIKREIFTETSVKGIPGLNWDIMRKDEKLGVSSNTGRCGSNILRIHAFHTSREIKLVYLL